MKIHRSKIFFSALILIIITVHYITFQETFKNNVVTFIKIILCLMTLQEFGNYLLLLLLLPGIIRQNMSCGTKSDSGY